MWSLCLLQARVIEARPSVPTSKSSTSTLHRSLSGQTPVLLLQKRLGIQLQLINLQ